MGRCLVASLAFSGCFWAWSTPEPGTTDSASVIAVQGVARQNCAVPKPAASLRVALYRGGRADALAMVTTEADGSFSIRARDAGAGPTAHLQPLRIEAEGTKVLLDRDPRESYRVDLQLPCPN